MIVETTGDPNYIQKVFLTGETVTYNVTKETFHTWASHDWQAHTKM